MADLLEQGTTWLDGMRQAHLSRLVTYERGVVLRTVRSLQFPEGTVELNTTLLLVPGIGEVSSDGSASGAPAVHRTLACATIGGRRVGDCRNLGKP